MSTRTELANKMGISVASVSMKIEGKRPTTPEERAIFTEHLGAEAGKAYDPDSVIEAQRKELAALSTEVYELRAENNQYRRGTKQAWVGASVVFAVALTLILIHIGPPWFRLQIEQVHANDRLRQENTHLAEKVEWLSSENRILRETNELYGKAFKGFREEVEKVGR